jgi:hypothetical protein
MPLSITFTSPRGTYNVTYDPQRPMAIDMLLGNIAIPCQVFIDENRPGDGHVVCGIAATGPGYWFDLRLDHPRVIEFWSNQVLDHVAEQVSEISN